MKIIIELYNSNWPREFEKIKDEIQLQLSSLHPAIEHIGSTSIPNIVAKPVIDILVGVNNSEDLDLTIPPLISKNYIYYEKYNEVMPYRRFFVKLQSSPDFFVPSSYRQSDDVPNELNDYKLAHIHILKHNSPHWIRHIAFRDYVKNHNSIKEEYANLKLALAKQDWIDGNHYNAAKNDFIKTVEAKAIEWYNKENKFNIEG